MEHTNHHNHVSERFWNISFTNIRSIGDLSSRPKCSLKP